MGACGFFVRQTGPTMHEAFCVARADALHESGYGGYTGTIAEKGNLTSIDVPVGVDPLAYADFLLNEADETDGANPFGAGAGKVRRDAALVSNKWGPAAGIDVGPGIFVFIGTASS